MLPLAPSLLPLKRPCSLSRSKTATTNPKFGVYIVYIYKFQRSLNISVAHARLQQYPIGPHFFGTICSVLMYLPSLSRQTTSIWLSAPCSNSLHLRSVQCLCLAPLLDTHRTTAFAVFAGNTLSLFWTIPIILGLAALTFASVRLNILCLGRCFEYKPLGGLLNCG